MGFGSVFGLPSFDILGVSARENPFNPSSLFTPAFFANGANSLICMQASAQRLKQAEAEAEGGCGWMTAANTA